MIDGATCYLRESKCYWSNDVRRVSDRVRMRAAKLHLFSEKNEKYSKFKIQVAIPSTPCTTHGAYCTYVYAATFTFSFSLRIVKHNMMKHECLNVPINLRLLIMRVDSYDYACDLAQFEVAVTFI